MENMLYNGRDDNETMIKLLRKRNAKSVTSYKRNGTEKIGIKVENVGQQKQSFQNT
jgi:hypothetical protein